MDSDRLYIQRELIELSQAIGQMAHDVDLIEHPDDFSTKISVCLRRFGHLVLEFKRWEPETISKYITKGKGK